MSERTDMANLVELSRQLNQVDPHSFHTRLGELKRGSFPTSSVPGGSRAADRPLPALDDHDRWLTIQQHTFSDGIEHATRALREAIAAQNAVRMVMGVNVTSPTLLAGETLEDAQRRAMRDARSKAAMYLADVEQGEHRFTCPWCEQQFKRTKRQRQRRGLCRACYDLWVAHDRPLHPPAEVIERRLARASDKAVGERLEKEATG